MTAAPQRLCLCLAVVVALAAAAAGDDPTKTLPPDEAAQPAPEAAKPDREAALRNASSNNLKNLGIAAHNYHDSFGRMPADVVGKDGKPLLSWRVALLPFLDEERLYKEFKLDEPWDSRHNLRLLERMPQRLQSPRVTLKRKGYTVYQAFAGPDAVFRPGQRGLSLAAITDGTSNTILAVESSTAVPWTRPADVPFDMRKELPDFGKAFDRRPLAVLMDGSVRLLDLKKISAETLRRAINPSDGQVIGEDWNQ